MIKLIFTLLLIGLVLMFTSRYLVAVEKEYTSQLLNTPEQIHYSHQFKNFSMTNTSASGKAQSVIRSPVTHMLTEQQQTLMDHPEMIMYRDNEPPIIITAKLAQVFHADNQTSLQDNVKVTMPNKNNDNIVMTTEQLTLDNLTQTAKTHLPATIIHGKGNMQGVGVEFNPHTKQIKFLTQVRGIYEQ